MAPSLTGVCTMGAMAEGENTEHGHEHGHEHGDDTQRLRARELNELIRYTMWSVYRVSDRTALDDARDAAADELTEFIDQEAGKGIVTRGCYDLQGMRADADYMVWWVAPTSDELQEMYVRFRRTRLGHAS